MPDVGAEVVVVTGASSGIGAEVAGIIAARGARVVLIGRRADALAEVAASLRPHERGAHLSLTCDVTVADDVEEAIARAEDQVGTPTALVNSAGICKPALLGDISLANWRETIDVNLTGSFLMMQAVVPRILRAGGSGSIVNVGSEACYLGMPAYAAYCASKAGLLGLSKALAAELAPTIRINVLCPGPVDTPMLRAELAGTGDADAAWQGELARVPLGRVASARETAEAAVWLLWEAVYSTGSTLSLDGGTTGAFMGANK